ncbi:MAG: hypothetical protein GXP28_05730 [Planctomycetes bacterium]|nr:hypothetical protein [Planctomycetota bacterium]
MLHRQSPIQHLFDPTVGQWGELAGARVVLSLDSEEVETKALQTLALCDMSALPKLGVKGPSAAEWLLSEGVLLPKGIYQLQEQSDGSLVVQLSDTEFLLEESFASQTIQALSEKLGWGLTGVARVERQEASFLLTGSRAIDVLAQTCAIDFRVAPRGRLVMTRVAGTSCSVLPSGKEGEVKYQIEVDATYAVSLWKSLLTICQELGGRTIGTAILTASGTTRHSK